MLTAGVHCSQFDQGAQAFQSQTLKFDGSGRRLYKALKFRANDNFVPRCLPSGRIALSPPVEDEVNPFEGAGVSMKTSRQPFPLPP